MNDGKTIPIVVVVGLTVAQVMSALHDNGARLFYNDEVGFGDKLAVETSNRIVFSGLPMFAHFRTFDDCKNCHVDGNLDIVIVVGLSEHDVMRAVFDIRHDVMVCSKATSDDEMGIEVIRRLMSDGSHLPVVMSREGHARFIIEVGTAHEGSGVDGGGEYIGVEFVDEFREVR